MTEKELAKARKDLLGLIQENTNLGTTRIKNLDETGFVLEGGRLQGTYLHGIRSLFVKGRKNINQYQNENISVSELRHAEIVISRWFDRFLEEDTPTLIIGENNGIVYAGSEKGVEALVECKDISMEVVALMEMAYRAGYHNYDFKFKQEVAEDEELRGN